MKKLTIVSLIFLAGIISVNAQDYRTGIGVRGGWFSGLSIKHFISETDALEGVLATHYRGVMIAGMYQKHTLAFETPGMNWYYGAGANLGFYDRVYSPWFGAEQTGNFLSVGVMGVVGIEYKLEDIPVSIGFDVTPAFSILGVTQFWFSGGLTLRYTIE